MNLDQQPLYVDLDELIQLSVDPEVDCGEYDCNITLEVDDMEHKAHTVSIAHRDLLFYTDKGTVQYSIDSYGDTHTAVLENVELD